MNQCSRDRSLADGIENNQYTRIHLAIPVTSVALRSLAQMDTVDGGKLRDVDDADISSPMLVRGGARTLVTHLLTLPKQPPVVVPG